MRKSKIEEANQQQIMRQREFRAAADVVVKTFMGFPEIVAIAVIGSVAKPLWKEVPRLRELRHAGIEIWHECADLDFAVWLNSRGRLGQLRRARDLALRKAYETGEGPSVASHQADVFLFEPESDRYLGRLCNFSECPKGKKDCLVPGCGAIAFNRIFAGFSPRVDLLANAQRSPLYTRKSGLLMSALNLPGPDEGNEDALDALGEDDDAAADGGAAK